MGNDFQYQILHQAKLLIMYESRIKFFKYLRTEKFISHASFCRKLQKDAFNQENEQRKRKTVPEYEKANSRVI